MSQKSASASASEPDPDDSDAEPQFVEVDPSGRYGRYKEVLGKGAFKKVYRAFDELEGIEVAWNQVKVTDLLRNSVDLERLYSEVHLLKTLKHKNIIKFYHSWVDTKNEHINFITEIFTSGNLRQYRKKHKHVDIRALKKWSKQILEGLWYLHSHDPPIIHRDLKCDNIFVNGNQGEVKIGDLGLAAILEQARSAHSVIGTPEFMAPELYEEEYNELVDIYAFGMCLLELVTLEYPYIECANAAQIYKKVTAGIKPASLEKVKDPEVRKFIEKCIAEVSERLTAEQLLKDPFLQPDSDSGSIQPPSLAGDNGSDFNKEKNTEDTMLHGGRDFMVEAQRKDRNTINLTLRIADSSGYIRNIHFPFDIDGDTSTNVAGEMVRELDLTDHDVSVIAAMIDAEIRSHIPDWEPRQLATYNMSTEEEILESGVEAQDSALDATTVSHESGSVPLEKLLISGRKYWSDSYKANGETSPPKPDPSDLLLEELVTSGDSSSEDANPSPASPLRHFEHDSNCDNSRKPEIKSILPDSQVGAIEQAVDTSSFKIAKTPKPNEFDSDEIKSVVEKIEHVLDEHRQELKQLKTKHQRDLSVILKGLPQEIRQSVLSICSRRRFQHKSPDDKAHDLMDSPDPPSSVMRGKKLGSVVEKCIRGPVSRSCFNSVRENAKSDLGISVILKGDKANS